MEFDVMRARLLRDTLVELSPQSLPPVHGGLRALESSPEEAAVIERFLPFAELILLVAAADGAIEEAEEKAVTGAFVALTGGRVSRTLLAKIRSVATERLRGFSPRERLEMVCAELSLNHEDAELAFALASAVALADDRIDGDESDYLQEIAHLLRLSRSQALRIAPRSERSSSK